MIFERKSGCLNNFNKEEIKNAEAELERIRKKYYNDIDAYVMERN